MDTFMDWRVARPQAAIQGKKRAVNGKERDSRSQPVGSHSIYTLDIPIHYCVREISIEKVDKNFLAFFWIFENW